MLQDVFQLVTPEVLLKWLYTSIHSQVLHPLNVHVQSCLQTRNKYYLFIRIGYIYHCVINVQLIINPCFHKQVVQVQVL